MNRKSDANYVENPHKAQESIPRDQYAEKEQAFILFKILTKIYKKKGSSNTKESVSK